MARTAQSEVVHLDTHVVCWLYEGRVEQLSRPAKQAIESAQPCVSPLVDLELALLHEIGRITKGPETVLSALSRDIGLRVEAAGFPEVVAAARSLRWTRDPFDRLICAQATLAGARLVSRDALIRRHCPAALW
ncbi:MAG: type II toxin-antitoxin system VapC family toxin [Betaproteobacteria bacterium]